MEAQKSVEKVMLIDVDQKGTYKVSSFRRYPNLIRCANDEPSLIFYDTHIQLGCVRITYMALTKLEALADTALKYFQRGRTEPFVLQEGTYEVKDPLGNVRKDAKFAQPNSDVVVPST